MKFGVEFGQFMRRRDNVMTLLRNIGSYYGDGSADFVTVVDVSTGSFVLSWTNRLVQTVQVRTVQVQTVQVQTVQVRTVQVRTVQVRTGQAFRPLLPDQQVGRDWSGFSSSPGRTCGYGHYRPFVLSWTNMWVRTLQAFRPLLDEHVGTDRLLRPLLDMWVRTGQAWSGGTWPS